jgi:hypothetical protein
MTTTTYPVHIAWADCSRLMRIGVNGHRALAVPTTGRLASREEILASAVNICPESEVVALLMWLEAERLNLTPVVTIGQQVAEITARPVRDVEHDLTAAEWEIIDPA